MSGGAPFSCPAPGSSAGTVTLAHGGGGRLMHRLLDDLILPALDDPALAAGLDSALLDLGSSRIAFTTDTFVVKPLFFPGGDIGKLAVNGTANDLAMCGARPLYLSAALVIEEGLPMETLHAVVHSLGTAARTAGARLVTGDTKVVERGKGDGLFVNTAGIGLVELTPPPEPSRIRPGDAIIVTGDVGRHGIAVMAEREGLRFETTVESDTAPLWPLVAALRDAGIEIRSMRDATRGGLATVLVELATAGGVDLEIVEEDVPVLPQVRAACEILGLDPLYVANEGRAVLFVPADQARPAVELLSTLGPGADATVIGKVTGAGAREVVLRNTIGSQRLLTMPSGEQLPRIC